MKICFIALFLMFATWLASGQTVGPGLVYYVTSAPSGACSANSPLYVVIGSGDVYSCGSGVWTLVGPGSGGGGANVHLSNLVAPTAVNVPLILPSDSRSSPSLQFHINTGIVNVEAGELDVQASGNASPRWGFAYDGSTTPISDGFIQGVNPGGLYFQGQTGGSGFAGIDDTAGTVRVNVDPSGNTELGNPAPSAGVPTGAEYTEVAGATGYLTTPALNGVVFGTASETVQQAMTATAGGMAQVPASSAASDNPLGTQLNSVDTPSSSSQTANTALIDYRYGGSVLSLFNPSTNSANPNNTSFPSGVIGNFTQLPSAQVGYNEWLSGAQLNAYDGGININQNGYGNKTAWVPFVSIVNGWAQGEKIGGGATVNGYGSGDAIAWNESTQCWGGSNAGSDEGCHGGDKGVMSGNVAYVGTAASGGTAGSTSITVTASAGAGTQGSGRTLIDTTSKTTATITTITGSGPLTFTASGTPFSASTNTTGSTAVTAPGVATISVASTSGITANSTLVCIYDSGSAECVIPTSIVANTSITANFRKPYSNSTHLCWGGQCGQYVELNADRWSTTGAIAFTNVLNTLRQAWLIVGSTTSTLTVWYNTSSGYGTYGGNALAAAGSNAATLYQGAEVLSVQASGTFSNTFTLAPNNVTFGTDAVEEPLYPAQKMELSNTQVFKAFHTAGSQAFGGGYTASGNFNSGDCFWCITDNAANTLYTGHGGNETVPLAAFYLVAGLVRNGLAFDEFPDIAIVSSNCPVNTSGAVDCTLNSNDSYKIFSLTEHSGTDYFAHNPDTGAFRLVGGGATVGFLWDSSGNFTTQNGGLKAGADNSTAGTLTLSNGSANAHTIWSSAATTSNTIAGFATAPTSGDLVSCTTSSTTCTLTDSGASFAAPGPIGGTTAAAGTFTTATATTDFVGPVGAETTPSFTITGHTTSGLYYNSNSGLTFTVGGTDTAAFRGAGTGLMVPSTGAYSFTTASTFQSSATVDTGLSRDSAAVVDVGNGTQGDKSATLIAATLRANTGFNANGTAGISSSGVLCTATFTTVEGIVTACTATSDPRLKDWQPSRYGLAQILQTHPIEYFYNSLAHSLYDHDPKHPDLPTTLQLGFNAANIKDVMPEAVGTDANGYLTLPQGDRPIVAALVKGMQEQQAEIEDLKAQIAALRGGR